VTTWMLAAPRRSRQSRIEVELPARVPSATLTQLMRHSGPVLFGHGVRSAPPCVGPPELGLLAAIWPQSTAKHLIQQGRIGSKNVDFRGFFACGQWLLGCEGRFCAVWARNFKNSWIGQRSQSDCIARPICGRFGMACRTRRILNIPRTKTGPTASPIQTLRDTRVTARQRGRSGQTLQKPVFVITSGT
jgi:hypothetical protein